MWPRRFFLNYHGLGEPARAIDAAERAYWLSVATFRDTLDFLTAKKASGIEFGITFDDGNASDYELAMPLLAERGLTARFFVLAGRIGQPGSLSAPQIREMAAAGMTIGSHGRDHIDWRRAPDEALKCELHDARETLQDVLGERIDSLAVPFGLFDRRVVAEARKAGYRQIFTSSGGFANSALGLIPRNCVQNGFSPNRDLPRMLSWPAQFRSAVRNPLRRLKYSGP